MLTAIVKICMLLQTDQQSVRRRATGSKYQGTVQPNDLSDLCNNTYCHSVVLVVVVVVVVVLLLLLLLVVVEFISFLQLLLLLLLLLVTRGGAVG